MACCGRYAWGREAGREAAGVRVVLLKGTCRVRERGAGVTCKGEARVRLRLGKGE